MIILLLPSMRSTSKLNTIADETPNAPGDATLIIYLELI